MVNYKLRKYEGKKYTLLVSKIFGQEEIRRFNKYCLNIYSLVLANCLISTRAILLRISVKLKWQEIYEMLRLFTKIKSLKYEAPFIWTKDFCKGSKELRNDLQSKQLSTNHVDENTEHVQSVIPSNKPDY